MAAASKAWMETELLLVGDDCDAASGSVLGSVLGSVFDPEHMSIRSGLHVDPIRIACRSDPDCMSI
jgi:hypothetical protein